MSIRITVLFILVGAFALACTDAARPPVAVNNTPASRPPAASPGGHEHGNEAHPAPRINLADAKKEFDAKTAVFVDTHAPEQYAQRHIPGSINIPANNVEPYLNKIPKGKKIIAYCS